MKVIGELEKEIICKRDVLRPKGFSLSDKLIVLEGCWGDDFSLTFKQKLTIIPWKSGFWPTGLD